jgi:hypothetical protein
VNIEQNAEQALKAAAVAEKQIAHMINTLKLETAGEKLGIRIINADKTSVGITVLNQPYVFRCRLFRVSEGQYVTKLALVREHKCQPDEECHRIFIDDLGNIALDPRQSSRMHSLNENDHIRWLCRTWVLCEADRKDHDFSNNEDALSRAR